MITAVDAETGEFRAFDRDSGVPSSRPSRPAVRCRGSTRRCTIDGRRYVDGGMRSAANADLAHDYDRLVVLAPIPRGVGPMASVDAQVTGMVSRVAVVSPDADSRTAIGRNVLDPAARARPRGRARAGGVGRAAGRRGLERLRHGQGPVLGNHVLDGYIAGPDGDMSWLTPYLGPNPEVDALQRRIGALLIGGRTFRGDDPNRGTDKEGAFSGTWTGPSFVVTHHPPAEPVTGVEFHADLETGSPRPRRPPATTTSTSWVPTIARQCLELGELDEVLAIIAPVLLGDGTPLFHHPGGRSVRLERISAETAPLATNVWMRVLR